MATNGVLNIEGPTNFWVYSALTNEGTVNWRSADIVINLGASASSVIWNQAGASWNVQCDHNILSGDQFFAGTGKEEFHNAGTFAKSATTGATGINVIFANAGLLDAETGTVSLTKSYDLTSGTLSVGISSPTNFGMINLSGGAGLTGTLSANLNGGFIPAVSNVFPILTYDSFSGNFTSTNLPPQAVWETTYGSTNLTINVVRLAQTNTSTIPVIVRQPVSVVTNVGADVAFTVGATGSPPLSYQWQFNDNNLPGATSATLTLTNVQTDQAGSYAVLVTNVAGSVTSSNALLTVAVSPVITQQPAGVTINQGASVSFAVAAAGLSPLSYQWQFNDTNLTDNARITGSQSNVLTLDSIETGDSGTYQVVVTNAYGSAAATATITVLLTAPLITWVNPADIVYGTPLGAGQLNATANVPGVFNYNYPLGTVLGAGNLQTLSVTFTPTDTSDYATVTAGVTINVTQAPLSITVNPATKAYGAPLPAFTFTYSGFVNGDSITNLTSQPAINTTATAASNVGAYPITVSGAADANYAISFVNASLTVTAVPLTITANPATNAYGAALPTFTVTYSGFVNGDTNTSLTTQPAINTAATPASNVGTYPITVNGATDANYTISFVNGTLTVTAAPLTITANPATKAYGAPLPTFTVTYSGFVNGDTNTSLTAQPTLNTTATAAGTVGTYPITVSGAADTNYAISFVNGTLTVTAVPLTITASPATKAYGAPLPTLTVSYSGFVNGDTNTSLTAQPALNTTATAAGNAGTYPITVSGAADTNYAIGFVNGTLTVTAVPLTITANPATKAYGAALPTFTLSYSGFVNGDTNTSLTTQPALSTTATAASKVGTYPITVSGAADTNYAISFVSGTLTVTAVPLTITANPATKAYGAPLPKFTFTYSGFVNGDTNTSLTIQPAASTTATNGSPAGGYPITVCCAMSPNYDISFVPGTLTITNVPALPTLTINDTMITAPAGGTTNVVFTVTLSAPGTQPVSVNFATADGTAQAGLDYVATNGALTFPAGLTAQVIPVSIIGHATTNSADESFFVNLSGATGATLARSQGTGTIHETVIALPSIVLVTPTDQSSYCYGNAVPLLASVSNSASPPTNVAFYYQSTNALGAVAGAPYSVSWSPTAPGDYSLTAVATFSDGSTLTSSPALVAVTTNCGQVAIVRSVADPEIALLQTNLFQLGLGSQVFDQAGLSVAILTNFELVIWDGLNGHITDNTVTVLYSVYTNGIPLYLIGDNLASDTPQLDEPAYTNWVLLTSLTPAAGKTTNGSVEIASQLIIDPILNGRFGTVFDFVYSNAVDAATLTNAGASILGQSGSAVVLVKNPGDDTDIGQTRIVTQNFQVAGGSDQNSLTQRQTLFLNSVWWLLGYQGCTQVYPELTANVLPSPAVAGQPLTLQWVVDNNGECDGIGAVLTCPLPAGAQFVGAQSDVGTLEYDANLATVIFRMGVLPNRTVETVSLTYIPSQAGTITNVADISIFGIATNETQMVTTINGLNLPWSGGTNYLLQLFGNAGQPYDIQTSPDLLQWTDWTNVIGPVWTTPLLDPSQTNFNRRFYRAVGQ